MEENLAFRALKLLKTRFKIDKNASIHIVKNIPLAAGLGGASSDAAAVLKGLNELWELRLSDEQLMALGAELGMDVPFFIIGGTALGKNFGEKITPLNTIQNIEFKITDKFSWSILPGLRGHGKTEAMYSILNLENCGEKTDKTEALLKAIEANDAKGIIENLHNDFESIVPLEKGKHLSGAGPATFTATIL
jgi:4-diphosphocytidyl-2-C-methyl-D-erythritol kinase